jgi:hypothetical protein
MMMMLMLVVFEVQVIYDKDVKCNIERLCQGPKEHHCLGVLQL